MMTTLTGRYLLTVPHKKCKKSVKRFERSNGLDTALKTTFTFYNVPGNFCCRNLPNISLVQWPGRPFAATDLRYKFGVRISQARPLHWLCLWALAGLNNTIASDGFILVAICI